MTDWPADGTPRGGARYVVTLLTSSLPMDVQLAPGLEFAGLSAFRSRSVEDSRERYRLHLGYFASLADAERALEALRPHYPAAHVAGAPAAGSGSLDDTVNASFTLLRGAVARLVASEQATAASTAGAPTLSPGEVASVMAPQRYAVQLEWSLRRIDPDTVPRLGIFRAYRLYAVSVLRQGSPEHGLRLGFFKNLDGARQVADYVRREFPFASVVPVSYREYARASALGDAAAPARPPATGEPAAPAPTGVEPAAYEIDASVTAAAGTAPEARARERTQQVLRAHDLEVGRDADGRVTVTAEERELLLRRTQHSLRRG